MHPPIASLGTWEPRYSWYILAILVAAVAVYFAAIQWKFFAQWLKSIQGRNWPTSSATIDKVDVTQQIVRTGRGTFVRYIATLAYVYRNPEIQMGDYSRKFGAEDEADARAWADSYKGSTVTIHVDPRDPSRSVLCKEGL